MLVIYVVLLLAAMCGGLGLHLGKAYEPSSYFFICWLGVTLAWKCKRGPHTVVTLCKKRPPCLVARGCRTQGPFSLSPVRGGKCLDLPDLCIPNIPRLKEAGGASQAADLARLGRRTHDAHRRYVAWSAGRSRARRDASAAGAAVLRHLWGDAGAEQQAGGGVFGNGLRTFGEVGVYDMCIF